MKMTLKQMFWRAVNSSVSSEAQSLIKLRKATSAGPEQELPVRAELYQRAERALTEARPDEPPPLDAATLACLNSFHSVLWGIRLKFFLYFLSSQIFAILSIGVFILGATFFILGLRDDLEKLKTILGGVGALTGLAGTLYTKPMRMVFRAAIFSSKVNLLCGNYNLAIQGCKTNKDLSKDADLQKAIGCVSDEVKNMLADLDQLALKYDQ